MVEKSCGAVVFTRLRDGIKYVIIRSKEGIYGFPKGHVELCETEKETALREVFEETGLRVSFMEGFKTEDAHYFTRNGSAVMKYVVYFLAEYMDQIPTAQEAELSGIFLMAYEEAMAAFQFESSKRILTEAHTFLTGGANA